MIHPDDLNRQVNLLMTRGHVMAAQAVMQHHFEIMKKHFKRSFGLSEEEFELYFAMSEDTEGKLDDLKRRIDGADWDLLDDDETTF